MSQVGDDYRAVVYASYLTARQEASPDVVAQHIQVRANHCGRIIREFFPPDRNASILELACGHGALLYHAGAAGYQNIRGVDTSPEQIAAGRRFGVANLTRGDRFDALAGAADTSGDAVVSLDLIEHLNKPELCRLVGEVARVLRPGGRWIIHCPNGESPFAGAVRYGDFTHELCFTQHSLGQLLRAYGFSRIECFEDGPVAHGPRSVARLVLWRAIRLGLRAWMVIETGKVTARPIFTQNLFCVAHR